MFSISPADIFNNIVAYYTIVLFEAVVVLMLTRWFRRFHDLTPPILAFIGIAAFGLMTLGINQLVNLYEWWIQPAAIQTITTETPNEEIADRIRQWLDDFHLQVQAKERGEAYFGFVVRNAANVPVEVMRLKKEREEFITLLGLVTIVESDQAKLKALSERQRELVYREIALELSRQRMGSISMNASQVIIEARVPLAELTQAKLIDRISDVTYVINLVILKVRTLLDSRE